MLAFQRVLVDSNTIERTKPFLTRNTQPIEQMKDCTGERYEGEFLILSGIEGWHGKFGHLNVLKMDHEGACTGFGKHNRVISFCEDHEGFYCRVDRVWELRDPTDEEIIEVVKSEQGLNCNLEIYKTDEWESGDCYDIYLKRV